MPVPQGRLVYSTGDLDYSIAARLTGVTRNKTAIFTMLWDYHCREILDVYNHETHRQGKAKAGHYTRVFK